MTRRWYRFAAGMALLVLTSLVLAACGEDEAETPPSPTAQTALIDHSDQSQLDRGQAAPGFTLPTSSGDTVSLAGYQGEPVLLFFHMAGG